MAIAAFLAARLDEDEAAAKAWLPFGNPDAAARDHIARHDPARVLREVAAGRLLLAEYASARLSFEQASREPRPDPRSDNARCAAYDARLTARMAHFQAVQRITLARAAVYSGHPGYRP